MEKKVFNDLFRICYNSKAYYVIQTFRKNVNSNELTLEQYESPENL